MITRPKFAGIIGLPFEATTTFLKGTANAPEAILEDVERMDGFDLELGFNPFEEVEWRVQFAHSKELQDPQEQQKQAYLMTRKVLDAGGFPLGLGGEHGVTLGPLKAVRERWPVGIVQLDAHADLRDSYQGNPLNHACAMRRAVELDCPLLGIGIRAISEQDHLFIRKHSIPIVEGQQAASSTSWYSLIERLPERVYLTIDMDVFDPSEVPGVGTPELGGPGYYAMVQFLRHLFTLKKVMAADIVELMPRPGGDESTRTASRLLGLILGLGVGKKKAENRCAQ